MRPALTPAQARLFVYLRDRIERSEPVPTYREMCAEFGWSSTATVRDHLTAMARKGYLQMSRRLARRITLRPLDLSLVTRVPIVGTVVAGVPSLAEESWEGRIPIPSEWAGSGSYFAVRVQGDSMNGAGIFSEDIVIARRQESAANGQLVVALVEGEATVKRLRKKGKFVSLVPENPSYQPIRIRTESASITGVVVGLLRSYRGRKGRSVR
jgi:repressor LexA